MALDLDRGVMTKFHPSGIKVNMYLDDPGTYLDEKGEPIAPQIAEQAGFNLEKDAREKLKATKLAQYKEELEREMASEEDAIAQALSGNTKYDVRHVGGGQYAVFDGEKRLTRVAMSAEDVKLLIGIDPREAADGEEASGEGASERPPAPYNPPNPATQQGQDAASESDGQDSEIPFANLDNPRGIRSSE